jgi:ApaG protein
MSTAVTSGIRITAHSRFEPAVSKPLSNYYFFSYTITIENNNDYPVQLLSRKWVITDEGENTREVEGPGVIGEIPVIKPGDEYAYSSGCDLRTLKGNMKGSYLMVRLPDDKEFRVKIPEFRLWVPYNLN